VARRNRNSAVSAAIAAVIALASWWWSAHHDANAGSAGNDSSGSSYTSAEHGKDPASGLPYVPLSALPAQAAQTVTLIDAGGPFPYPTHDGGTFGNFEGLLPKQSSGYYKEYTVPTPGSSDRGTRRIIAGSNGTLYWTGDHYEHFAVIQR
jgi:ribonuclease T1